MLKLRRTAVKGVFELLLFPGSKPGPAGRSVIRQATTDPKLTEHWLTDPSHKLKLSLGEATSLLNFTRETDTYAKQVSKPILVVVGLNDHLVSPRTVAKLFKDIPSNNKTFLIDGTGEHLVLEEGKCSPALTAKLVDWMKTDAAARSAPSLVEVIDEQALSAEEKRHLSNLRRLGKAQYAGN